MKTITLEIEDNYWLEIVNYLQKFPIKIIEQKNDKLDVQQKTPLEEIGFIGCGAADENLSVNYKDKLTGYLKEKHNL